MTAKAMQALRARRKDQGLVRVEVWVPEDYRKSIKSIAATANNLRDAETKKKAEPPAMPDWFGPALEEARMQDAWNGPLGDKFRKELLAQAKDQSDDS